MALTASDEEALSVAEAENLAGGGPPGDPAAGGPAPAAAEGGGAGDLDLVLWGMAQSDHLIRSSRLAEVIQDEMNRLLGVESRGIKQAPFAVLMGATMPAVLVEVAFLSNEQEEKELAQPEFRDRVAQALESAIARFKAESEGALTAAPAAPAWP
jgi:N-acetylmuramoyl-L-alanine amidase